MATLPKMQLLSLNEFRAKYAAEKPYYEYWFGEAIQKSVPTVLHGLLQQVLCALFKLAGYRSGSEIELRIAPDWQPKPDVIAYIEPIKSRYPTEPVDIVAEVLSPEDSLTQTYKKCQQYHRLGIKQIFVFDPEGRVAWQWSAETQNLERIEVLLLGNGASIRAADVWSALAREAE